MRRLILAALGVFAVAGVASAQQPSSPQPPVYAPAAVAGTPIQPAPSATVIRGGAGCTGCGTAAAGGGNCQYGYGCQNGCGSIKSDLAFQFGSCKSFFSPCGPTSGHCGGHGHGHGGGFFGGGHCPVTPFAPPYGTGWLCPRQYDTYANH